MDTEAGRDPAIVAEISKIMDDFSSPYYDSNSRGHAATKARVRELHLSEVNGSREIYDGVIQSEPGASPAPQSEEVGSPVQRAAPDEEAPAPEGASFLERVPGPDSPPPDPGLAPVWSDDAGLREVVTSLSEIEMPAEEVVSWIKLAGEDAEIPQPAETLKTLRQEWGPDFDEKLAGAQLVIEKLPPSVATFLNATGLGDHPDVIRRMATLGEPLLRARGQIEAIRKNPRHPYNDAGHPRHQAARAEVRALYKKVYSDRPA